MSDRVAIEIVEMIVDDIQARKGLDSLWDSLDDDIKDEITDCWTTGITDIINGRLAESGLWR